MKLFAPALIAAAVVFSASTRSRADDSADAADAAAANEEGERLYASSEKLDDAQAKMALKRAALGKLLEAFTLDPLPSYLFNVAQMARLIGDCPTALGAYQRYSEILTAAGNDLGEPGAALLTKEKIPELKKQCTASDEFANKTVASDPTTSATGPEKPDPTVDPTVTTPIMPGPEDDRPGSNKKLFWGVSIGSAVVAVGLAGYGGLQLYNVQWGHFQDDFKAASDAEPPVGSAEDSTNPCEHPGIRPGPQAVCDDADSATRRGNIAFAGALGFGIAAGVFAYLASRESSEPSLAPGPGDVGMSWVTRF